MKYYAAVNDEYLAKSIKDGSLAIFEEKKDAERVCNKMNYDLIEVSIVNHKTYSRLTEENAKLREFVKKVSELDIETLYFETKDGDWDYIEYVCTDIVDDADDLLAKLNQLKEQTNDK